MGEPFLTNMIHKHIDGTEVKEKLNSSALAMELCLSCINPLACPKQFARVYTSSSTQCLMIHSLQSYCIDIAVVY